MVQQKVREVIPIIFANHSISQNFLTFNFKIHPYINIVKLKDITTNIIILNHSSME